MYKATIASVSGTDSATTIPVRQPSVTKATTNTTVNAQKNLMRKVFTASRILALWSSTCVSRAPAGSVRRTCSAAARIALPKPSPSALGRIDTARMTADRPSWRTTASGGSAKPRATVAISPKRIAPDGVGIDALSRSRTSSTSPSSRTGVCIAPCTPPAGAIA